MSKPTLANLSVARPSKRAATVSAAAREFAGEEKLARLSIDVPASLKRELKALAATRDKSVRALVIEALRTQYSLPTQE